MTQTTNTCALGRQKCTPRNLTETVHCVARHSGIDTHRLAELLEVDYATFVRWTAPNGICELPGRKFAALAQHTSRFDHIAYIGADAGLCVSSRPRAIGSSNRVRELLDAMEQFGCLAASDRDLAIGGFSGEEKHQQRAIVRRVQQELAEYEQALG